MEVDPEIFDLLSKEMNRNREGLELIASENYVSVAVMQAVGSHLTNKYSEGYPYRRDRETGEILKDGSSGRYYGGNEYVDISETLAIERAKKLFGVGHANVQPHAGCQANLAAYAALMNIGDRAVGLSLSMGGHLSHGFIVSFTSKAYDWKHYGLSETDHRIDMDAVRRVALDHKPKVLLAGFSAYPRDLDYKAFREIADEVGAYLMADIAHVAGLVAAKVVEDPAPYCDVITSTTHKTLRGPRGAICMCKEELGAAIDKAVFPGMQGGPLEHAIAAKAVAFKEAMSPDFKEYSKQILKNAKALAETMVEEGMTVITGGTDNHIVLLDITGFGIGGKTAETTLDFVQIHTNKNTIPFDKRRPFDPSGIRIGTPALTTRGMIESDFRHIGRLMKKALKNHDNAPILESVRDEAKALAAEYPLYPGYGI